MSDFRFFLQLFNQSSFSIIAIQIQYNETAIALIRIKFIREPEPVKISEHPFGISAASGCKYSDAISCMRFVKLPEIQGLSHISSLYNQNDDRISRELFCASFFG